MKKVLYFLSLIILVLLGNTVWASTFDGKVTAIHVRDVDGMVWIYVEGTRKGTVPACATKGYFIVKNENSAAGKRQLATLMMAQAMNKRVLIEGYSTCTRWGDGEDINTVSIWQE